MRAILVRPQLHQLTAAEMLARLDERDAVVCTLRGELAHARTQLQELRHARNEGVASVLEAVVGAAFKSTTGTGTRSLSEGCAPLTAASLPFL